MDSRPAFRARVLSSEGPTAYAALLELYTFQVLRDNFTKVLYEPQLNDTAHRPEFRATRRELRLTVECLVFDKETIRFAQDELGRLVDYLQKLRSTYSITVQPQGLLSERITPRKIEAFLRRELGKLSGPVNEEQPLIYQEVPGSQPVNFFVMGAKDDDDDDEDTIQSWWPTGDVAQDVTTDERIIVAVDEKVSRYGRFDEPYVIAIWPRTMFPPNFRAVYNALYGTLSYTIDLKSGKVTGHTTAPDGAFTRGLKAGKPTCTRVSAVAIYRLHMPDRNHHEHRLSIFHNPYAEYPLPTDAFPGIPQYVVKSRSPTGFGLEWLDGIDGGSDE